MSDPFLEQLIERLDKIDPASLQGYMRKLSREKGFMETISNTIREGIIVIEEQRNVFYVNPAAREMLGLPEKIIGQPIERFIKEVNWNQILGEDPSQWHSVSRQELEVFYPLHRILNFYVVPHSVDEDGSGYGYAVIILNDITEDRQTTEKQIESQTTQVISMLAASVAHEIGNPLNSINIHLQLLERMVKRIEDERLKDQAQDAVSVVKEELDRLDTIINNFLKAIRPASLDMERVHVEEILADSLKFMKHEIENKGIMVQAEWGEHVPAILGDKNQLRQAFYNIIKNGIQAMPDGGLFSISCIVEEDQLVITFADTGKGISSKEITRILDPYYTTKQEGSGLGLLVVERIVRDHGGDLTIKSEVAKGTIFLIHLPLRNKEARLLRLPSSNPDDDDVLDH